MKVRRILFLLLGLERVYPPRDRKHARSIPERLIEPDGARACRRNILALASVVVVSEAAGANPQDLEIFGVQPSNEWGVRVLGATAVLAHVYWYVVRYFHLRDDGKVEQNQAQFISGTKYLKIEWSDAEPLVRRGADLLSNWAAVLLTVVSWGVIGFWMFP